MTVGLRASGVASTVLAVALACCAPLHAERSVAVTLDDLPFTGGPSAATEVAAAGNAIVDALVRHEVPASGFVTGRNALVDGQADLRLGLLERWAAAGLDLENHGFSHLSYGRAERRVYLDDLVAGQTLIERVLKPHDRKVRFYRAPFNHTGDSAESKQALLAFLAERGVRLAPFTVEHADYVYNSLYVDAVERGDDERRRRIGKAYLAALDRAFEFAEALSRDTFEREIPQVFLIHTNLINAHHLDAMLARLKARGYRFVSLADAMQDAGYATPNTYAGPYGISWLHRWRHGLDLPDRLRDEPDPERWVLDAYRARP